MSHDSQADQDFIRAALPAFMSEAAEQIEAIERLLLELEEQPDNRELLDSLFRCAHTVKGSAGIFGLARVVEFTHHVETLLDKMRDGKITLTPDINTLLLKCNDQIQFLVQTAVDEGADTPEQKDLRADLVVQLRALCEPAGVGAVAASAAESAAASSGEEGGTRVWSISARFGADTFRNGMDPLSIARYLGGLGRVVSMRCVTDPVPPPHQHQSGELLSELSDGAGNRRGPGGNRGGLQLRDGRLRTGYCRARDALSETGTGH